MVNIENPSVTLNKLKPLNVATRKRPDTQVYKQGVTCVMKDVTQNSKIRQKFLSLVDVDGAQNPLINDAGDEGRELNDSLVNMHTYITEQWGDILPEDNIEAVKDIMTVSMQIIHSPTQYS